MPIYEYYCSDCDDRVDVLFLSLAEAREQSASVSCPECGGSTLERVPSTVGFSTGPPPAADAGDRGSARSARSNSSAELARTMRRESSVKPDRDFHEVASRLDCGESPTSIETSLRDRVGEKMQAH